MCDDGGDTIIQQPSPPSAPSIGSSIQEFVQAQPQLFALQQQQAPQEVQQQLDLFQQFGPQFGQAMQDAQRALNPQTTGLQEQLAGEASQGIEQGLTGDQEAQFLSDFRANLGTNAGSPIGAFETSRQFRLADEGAKQNFRNLGLSLAGNQQLAQPQSGQFTNQVGNFQPGQALGFNQGVFGSQANLFGSQAGMFNNQSNINAQPAPWEGIVGSLAGGVGSGIGFGLGKKFG